MEEFAKYTASILVGFISAYFGSLLAIVQFKKEKLWLRRKQAYVDIIDALYDLLQHCQIHKEDYGQGTGYSEEKENEFKERYNKAFWKIKKATDIGAFVISNEAHEVLMGLRNRERLNWEDNPRFDIYEHEYEHFKGALDQIVKIARKELNAAPVIAALFKK